MAKIIAFCGVKGSGKTTAAKALESKSLELVNLADELKKLCSEQFNLKPIYFNAPNLKDAILENSIKLDKRALRQVVEKCYDILDPEGKYHPFKVGTYGVLDRTCATPRNLLQVVGTDFVRDKIYKHFWVDALSSKLQDKKTYLIGDLRFESELDRLKCIEERYNKVTTR